MKRSSLRRNTGRLKVVLFERRRLPSPTLDHLRRQISLLLLDRQRKLGSLGGREEDEFPNTQQTCIRNTPILPNVEEKENLLLSQQLSLLEIRQDLVSSLMSARRLNLQRILLRVIFHSSNLIPNHPPPTHTNTHTKHDPKPKLKLSPIPFPLSLTFQKKRGNVQLSKTWPHPE